MENTLSLRERKKYQTMLNILNEFLKALENNYFDEIYIEDICNRISISKVTFFRYFTSKEEVLDYFVLQWCYRRSVEIDKRMYSGIDGIRHVFQTAAEIPHANKILLSLIQYYSKLKAKPIKKELSAYERYIISQNSAEGIHVKVFPLEIIFQTYLLQVENISEASMMLLSQQLLSLFYGIPFQLHIQGLDTNQLQEAYRNSLDILFKDMSYL